MKLRIKGEEEEKVLVVSLVIDYDGDVMVLYNDITVGYVSHAHGGIKVDHITSDDRTTLEKLGVEFNDNDEINIS